MITATSFYTLIIFSLPVQIGDEPIYIDIRKMTFAECRMMRNSNLAFYEMLRNQEVTVLCHLEKR